MLIVIVALLLLILVALLGGGQAVRGVIGLFVIIAAGLILIGTMS